MHTFPQNMIYLNWLIKIVWHKVYELFYDQNSDLLTKNVMTAT